MPLHTHKHLNDQAELGLWKIEEDEIFFLEQLQLNKEEEQYIAGIKGHRRLEWLASRFLLHKMSGRAKRGPCIKDEHGKPFLVDSLFDISISHSREFASVIAAPQCVGIDIQKIVSKIERIAHKYMRDEETESLKPETRLEHLHVYWGAKEALYKAYGRRQLDFREHIFIDPFDYDVTNGRCTGYTKKGEDYQAFDLRYELVEKDYMLVYGMEVVGKL
ncbi:MAG: 4'-phosphopantetheinyl transferase superfamily protein [Saprospiraceae bacterium]